MRLCKSTILQLLHNTHKHTIAHISTHAHVCYCYVYIYAHTHIYAHNIYNNIISTYARHIYMKKYNKDGRARRKAYTHAIQRATHTHDKCNARDRIRIYARYTTYNKMGYISDIYRRTRDNRSRIYTGMTNAMNEIFPEINAPHNAHTYRAIAPYRVHIHLPTDNIRTTRYTHEDAGGEVYKDTRTTKCIIFNDDRIIYMGTLRRTRIVDTNEGTIRTTLHRNKRTMDVKDHIADPDTKIHGVTIRDIKAHDVELYDI